MIRPGERPFEVVGVAGFRRSARAPDRRNALAGILEMLAHRVRESRDGASLRTEFEAALQQALKVSRIRLRENPPPSVANVPAPAGSVRQVAVDVPTPRGVPTVVLEVTVDHDAQLDGWDGQLLGMAAHLAALVTELERCHKSAPRQRDIVRRPDCGKPSLSGASPAMTTLRENIVRVAETDFTVLIEGESGTGKELVARQLHHLSRRRHGPFVAVNCAAIVESLLEAELFGIEDRTATGVRGRRGKFEHADGGTLFLDEVSDLAPAAQAKLLRAIQELTVERVGGHASRRVDARIVIATNKSLRELVAAGQFRADLFYRLSGVELHVPPLRARRQDIPELCAYFLSRYQVPRPIALNAEAAEAMQLYDWPGNVRELERLIEGAVALAANERITLDDLPAVLRGEHTEALRESLDRNDTMRAWGARYARLVLGRCQQNKRKTCEVLDISYHTLMAYLRWKPRRERVDPGSGDWPEVLEGRGSSNAVAQSDESLEQTSCR